MFRILPFLSLLAWVPSWASAGTLTTLQGTMAVGTITLDGGTIALKQADGQTLHVDPLDILHAVANPSHSLHRGLQLTSGEIIAVDAIQKLDDAGVHATLAGGKAITIPADRVARIIFRHIPSAMESHLAAGQVGVVLETGDFFQGELRELNGDHARVDSVLFGVQNFDMNNQALAIVLHDTVAAGASWIVRDTHGSVFFAEQVKATDGKLTFEDSQLGPIEMPQDQLAQIDAGGKRTESLADLKPSNASAGEFKIDRTMAGVPMTLRGAGAVAEQTSSAITRGISQHPGTTLSWQVSESVQSFVATVGVPASLMPVGTVQFAVIADGHELWRSRPLSSIDDPQSIAVGLAGITTLTLSVVAPSSASGIEGLWLNPLCVRR